MDKEIVIIGVGALGSHLVPLLRNIGSITVIDFDRIEHKNVLSQFHALGNVGKNKATSLRDTMNFLFKVKIVAIPNKLVKANVLELLEGSKLVVDCVDNGETRRLIQDHVQFNGIPCLHGALAPNGTFGQVIWDDFFTVDDETGAGAATCENGEHLPFISTVSSYMALAIQRFMKTGKQNGFQIHPNGVTPV